MYKRSRSSSNIPIPSSIKSKARESSLSRLGNRDSNIPVIERKASLDRPHLPRACLFTPTEAIGSVRKHSQKYRANSLKGSFTPKTSQKLTNDKSWVAKQYSKVQNFVQASGLFDPQIANPGNLKPPTINTFVYICNVLLREIFPKIKIDNVNYKEVIPAHLKLLKYKGVMTNSMMKTVNMPNSFPHVISVFSFLMDCVSVSNYELDCDNFDDEMRQLYQLKQVFLELNIGDYCNFQMDNVVSSEEVIKEYVNIIVEIMNIDMEKIAEQKNILEVDKKRIESQELKIKELQESMEIVKKEKCEIQNKIDEIDGYLASNELSLVEEIKFLQTDIAKIKTKEEETVKEVKQLEECISVQKCSFEDKKKMLLELDDLKRHLPLKREKLDEMMKIKDEFDYRVADLVNQIETEVYKWNNSIMKASINSPDIKILMLRDRNFTADSFDQEISKTLENKLILEEAIKTTRSQLKIEIDCIEKLVTNKEDECKELEKQVDSLGDRAEIKKNYNMELEIQRRDLVEKHKKEKNSYIETLRELKDNKKLENQKKLTLELQNQEQKMKQDLMKLSKKCVNFFLDLNVIMVNKFNDMDGVLNGIREDLTDTCARLVMGKRQKNEMLKRE